MVASFITHNCFAATALEVSITEIKADILFIRHALAPGIGDPKNFLLSDCDTQRNLNEEGRKHSKEIGKYILSTNLKIDKIYASEWCRCHETALHMNLGNVKLFSGLNSFFQNHSDKGNTLQLLQKYLEEKPSNELIIMVTHQVVISAVTNLYTKSGQLVAYNSKTGESQKILMSSFPLK
ncbi:histidine phosphatase family protein [Alphaproteobacteria bacterium]|nr:histidine phosphatase family protein [Alphaproteobacteria bacterium]